MSTAATASVGNATTRFAGGARVSSDRIAALSGLTFVALAVGQNIIRVATAAPNDARSVSIIAHFVDHREAELVLAATVVGGAFALALFVGHLWTRLARGAERGWAQAGIIGVMGIFAIFPLLVACEVALLVITGRPSAGPDAVETLWALHNAVFTVNLAALAVATLGLSAAALRGNLLPRAFRIIGPLAAGLLTLGALFGSQIAAGNAKPIFALSGLGYIGWLSVVAVISVQLLRAPQRDVA